MQNSRTFILIKTLDDAQMRDLKRFVRSKYYNQREDVVLLLDFLWKKHKAATPKITRQAAYDAMYPQATFNSDKLRLVLSFLLRLIEEYLLQTTQFGKLEREVRLAGIYRSLNLPKHFESQLKRTEKEQAKTKINNADYFETTYKFEGEKYDFATSQRRRGEVYLEAVGNNLDIAYFSKKLQHACLVLAQKTVQPTDYSVRLLEEILDLIEKENYLKIPVISVYYHCFQALRESPDSGWFERFRTELETHASVFPKEELGELYRLALNFCIRQYNAGNKAYLEEEFELYRESLEAGFLYIDSFLSRFTYRNILTVCIALNKLEWAEEFNEKYKIKVREKYRESSYSFNFARLEYRRKNYKKALLLLQKSEFEELFINVAAKIVMLKIYHETREWDVLFSHIQNLKNYIYRQKDLGYHRENYLNFLKYANKLTEKTSLSKVEINKLIEAIKNEGKLAERDWLIEQLKS